MRLQVQTLALLGGLGIQCCRELWVGCRCDSDPELLWLWHRPVATALIRLLAWEPPYATGAALEKTKKKKVNVIFKFSFIFVAGFLSVRFVYMLVLSLCPCYSLFCQNYYRNLCWAQCLGVPLLPFPVPSAFSSQKSTSV